MTSTSVAQRSSSTFSTFMAGDSVKRKISEIIAGKKGDAFITSIVASVSTNPTLASCDNGTILSAGLQGAALDLSPSPALGHFYMVPFDDRKNNRKVAQFQIGYKGYIQLAIRSGQYRRINVIALKEGELISYNRLTEEIFTKLIDDDEVRDKLPTAGYYAMFELTNGFIKTMYWSQAKMENHAMRYSKGYAAKKGYTFWEKDFDGMAFKTMLRQLLSKWGVMSVELQKAFESDMGVLDSEGRPDYIDNTDSDIPGEIVGGPDDACEEVERQTYPDDQFARAFTSWEKAIKNGKSPDEVIKTAESKFPLTDDQKAKVRGVKKAESSDAAGVTFAQVAEKMNKATDIDLLDAAYELVGEVSDPAQRDELSMLYGARKEELSQ